MFCRTFGEFKAPLFPTGHTKSKQLFASVYTVASNMNQLGCPFFTSNKKMRNEAKRSEKDAKQKPKLARLSETTQNKVRMTQFCLHNPLKTILNQKETSKSEPVSHVSLQSETSKTGSLFACFFWLRSVFRGSCKQN
jgi:hypothetical protein